MFALPEIMNKEQSQGKKITAATNADAVIKTVHENSDNESDMRTLFSGEFNPLVPDVQQVCLSMCDLLLDIRH